MKRYIISTAVALLILGGYGAYKTDTTNENNTVEITIMASK